MCYKQKIQEIVKEQLIIEQEIKKNQKLEQDFKIGVFVVLMILCSVIIGALNSPILNQ